MNEKAHLMTSFILSNGNSQNSHGFRIDLSGLNLDRFKKNPVMLYNHNNDRVIGRWENIRIEDNKLMADADIDIEDPVGKEVARKVEQGYLKGCSMGIYIDKMVDTDNGMVATKTELLEASIVAIPSDAEAVSLYDENNEPISIEQVRLKYNFNTNIMNNKNIELTAATLSALGVDDGATAQTIELAVDTLKQQMEALSLHAEEMKLGIEEEKRRACVLEAEKKQLEAEKRDLEAAMAQIQQEKVEELVNQAIAAKKIGADEKETYLSLAEKDFDGVSKILGKMKGVTPVVGQLGATATSDGKAWEARMEEIKNKNKR